MTLQLENIIAGFWVLDCNIGTNCPYCEANARFKIEITQKHVRLDCPSCNKVFFYRRVNLGALE